MASILITGGSGAFGQAFVEHLLKSDKYARICIYSRDEWKQAQMRRRFKDDQRLRFFVGCVRDKERLTRAFHGVDVVIHAAALKRIEVGAYAPDEVVKTNINGTMNVIDAAAQSGVKKVVFLSTDKAWQPISPYGQSKAIAESLILNANNMFGEKGPKFAVTRYGNVAGSTGSVIPVWHEAIKNREPIFISDPNVTRFWMTMEQAVQLVLDTIEKMPREPVIPTLPAYCLGDLASAMGIESANKIGLAEYEKLHEGMADGNTSDVARRMTIDEIREALKNV